MTTWNDILAKAAIDVMASVVMSNLLCDEIGEQWENYPEIGEHDWLKVQEQVIERAKRIHPSPDNHHDAYAILAKRAEGFVA